MSIRSIFKRMNCFTGGMFGRGFCSVPFCSKCPEWNKTIPFIPPINGGWVIKVYDGDTITVACKYPKRGNQLYRFSVRLAGINAPEMNADSFIERVEANISKNELHRLVFNETVKLENIKTEKYGRLLADVYLADLHINNWLLENNYAVPYYGGSKNRKLNFEDN